MNFYLNLIIAIIAGLFIGSAVNMAIVSFGPYLIPPPEGSDMSTAEGLRNSIQSFKPIHFITPFLAHAIGTGVGAFVAARIATKHRLRVALVIGVAFLSGGIVAINLYGGPLWFCALDLLLAYIPMAYLGAYLAGALRSKPQDSN